MRIMFQYLYGGGGALSNIIMLLQAIARCYPEDSIDVVCSPDSGLNKLGTLPNVSIVHFGEERRQEWHRMRLNGYRLRSLARARKADVLWSLNLSSYIPVGIPTVLSINNPHQVYPIEVTRFHPRNAVAVRALRSLFRLALRRSDAAITQTELMKQYVGTWAPDLPIHVIPKAVENADESKAAPLPPEIQARLAPRTAARPFTFLFVSTNSPHKNHVILIEAFDVLRRRGVDARVMLTLDDEQIEQIGRAMAKELIASGHVIPVGWVEKRYLRAFYDEADACVMPSILESLSSAHIEAMQWGKPQITADVPFAHDICGDAAIYVDAHAANAWADAVELLMNDPARRAELVRNGRVRMAMFPESWDTCARAVHDVLAETVRRYRA